MYEIKERMGTDFDIGAQFDQKYCTTRDVFHFFERANFANGTTACFSFNINCSLLCGCGGKYRVPDTQLAS